MLWIQNVTRGQRSDNELHDYVVRINSQPPLALFRHVRSDGAATCLRKAAEAIEHAENDTLVLPYGTLSKTLK